MYSVLEPAAPVGRSTSKATHKHTQTRTSESLADSQLARRGGGVMRRPRPAGAPTRPANAGHASSDLKTRATLGCTRRGGAPAVTPPPIGERSIVMCASVCVSLCPRSYLRNYTSDLHQFCCARYLWPWLGPRLYFRFYQGRS